MYEIQYVLMAAFHQMHFKTHTASLSQQPHSLGREHTVITQNGTAEGM